MSLWVDKYRPRTLDELDYHPALSSRLSALVRLLPPLPGLRQPSSSRPTSSLQRPSPS